MREEQLQHVSKLWVQILKEESYRTVRADLDKILNELTDDAFQPRRVYNQLHQLLANKCFQSEMQDIRDKYESRLRALSKGLYEILCKRKKLAGAIAEFCRKQRITTPDGRTIECDFVNSGVWMTLCETFNRYADERVSARFPISQLRSTVAEIQHKMESDDLNYFRDVTERFSRALQATEYDESRMRSVTSELIGELIRKGYTHRELMSWATTLSTQDIPSHERMQNLLSKFSGIPHRWIVFTSVEDVKLLGLSSLSIGNATFHGSKFDFSDLLERIGKTSIRSELKDDLAKHFKEFQGKVTVEVQTLAYDSEQAGEMAQHEISKAIDVLSILDPNFLVREPAEQEAHEMIALDIERDMLPVYMFARRLELYGVYLNAKRLARLNRLLDAIGPAILRSTNHPTEFENRILTAMHFYRRGNYAFDPIDKVVNYIIALESMLIMRWERPSTTLPKRVVDVLWVAKEYRPKVKKLVREAYRLRGDILHSGRVRRVESKLMSAELLEVNRKVLSIAFSNLNRADSLKKLLEITTNDAALERERKLKSTPFEVNREYSGTGVLKRSDGSSVGHVEFTLCRKDDGKYVYTVGSIAKFTQLTPLSGPDRFSITGELKEVAGEFRFDLSDSLDSMALVELVTGKTHSVSFRVQEVIGVR